MTECVDLKKKRGQRAGGEDVVVVVVVVVLYRRDAAREYDSSYLCFKCLLLVVGGVDKGGCPSSGTENDHHGHDHQLRGGEVRVVVLAFGSGGCRAIILGAQIEVLALGAGVISLIITGSRMIIVLLYGASGHD